MFDDIKRNRDCRTRSTNIYSFLTEPGNKTCKTNHNHDIRLRANCVHLCQYVRAERGEPTVADLQTLMTSSIVQSPVCDRGTSCVQLFLFRRIHVERILPIALMRTAGNELSSFPTSHREKAFAIGYEALRSDQRWLAQIASCREQINDDIRLIAYCIHLSQCVRAESGETILSCV